MTNLQQRAAAAWLLLAASRCTCFHEFDQTGDYDGFGPDDTDMDVALRPFGSEKESGAVAAQKASGNSTDAKEPKQIFLDLSKPETELPKQGFLQKPTKAASPAGFPPRYWSRVDTILSNAGKSTPQPSQANEPFAPPTPEPYHQVIIAKHQPLDTRIGAKLMYETEDFHIDNTPTPPPSSMTAINQFVAPCPMVLFMKEVNIYGADSNCDEDNEQQGKWIDPDGKRTLLRWRRKGSSGVFYGVDSALSGPGSVMFGEMNYQWVLNGVSFEFRNCMQVGRYFIDEEITKVTNIGKGIDSTFQTHNVADNGVGYFLRYVIRFSNRTIVAQSNMFRMYSDQVNFSTVRQFGGVTPGSVIATAQRVGDWKGKGWRCNSARYWHMEFPLEQRAFDSLATAADLRTATSAIITLMARRDEDRAKNALLESTQWELTWYIVMGVLILIQICCVGCMLTFLCNWAQIKEKLRIFFNDVEEICMPKKSMKQRVPPIHATY